MKMEYYWWEKIFILPVRRFCRRLASRLGARKTGLIMLSQEVQACEYEDVHIMWEMLQKSETHDHQVTRSPKLIKIKAKPFRSVFAWTRATCLSNF